MLCFVFYFWWQYISYFNCYSSQEIQILIPKILLLRRCFYKSWRIIFWYHSKLISWTRYVPESECFWLYLPVCTLLISYLYNAFDFTLLLVFRILQKKGLAQRAKLHKTYVVLTKEVTLILYQQHSYCASLIFIPFGV